MDHVIGKLWLFHCHGENQIDESRLLVLGWYPKVRAGFWMLIPSNMVVYNGNRFLTHPHIWQILKHLETTFQNSSNVLIKVRAIIHEQPLPFASGHSRFCIYEEDPHAHTPAWQGIIVQQIPGEVTLPLSSLRLKSLFIRIYTPPFSSNLISWSWWHRARKFRCPTEPSMLKHNNPPTTPSWKQVMFGVPRLAGVTEEWSEQCSTPLLQRQSPIKKGSTTSYSRQPTINYMSPKWIIYQHLSTITLTHTQKNTQNMTRKKNMFKHDPTVLIKQR